MDWKKATAGNVAGIPASGIRKFFDLAATLDGVLSLAVGEPDFPAPDRVIQAAVQSLKEKKTHYTSNWGLLELRQEIAKHLDKKYGLSYDPEDEVLVTVGVSEAIGMVLFAFLNPGDEVLIPDPAYLAYPACVTLAHGVPVLVPTDPADGYKLRVSELEKKVTPKTKALIIGYPNNPTGTVMDRESLLAIADFAEKHDLLVISDEIYCDLTYEGKHIPFATLPGMRERTLTMNGFSKSYAMTGLRVGYVCGPREALAPVYKVHQYEILCAAAPSQYGAIAALRYCDDDVKAMVDEYKARRDMVYEAVSAMGLPVNKPQGAFYLFPDISCTGMDEEMFCDRLLREEKVATVPGDCFGPGGKNHIRISYAASRETIAEAMKRMARFVEKYRK